MVCVVHYDREHITLVLPSRPAARNEIQLPPDSKHETRPRAKYFAATFAGVFMMKGLLIKT
jgi:hypothetical protein